MHCFHICVFILLVFYLFKNLTSISEVKPPKWKLDLQNGGPPKNKSTSKIEVSHRHPIPSPPHPYPHPHPSSTPTPSLSPSPQSSPPHHPSRIVYPPSHPTIPNPSQPNQAQPFPESDPFSDLVRKTSPRSLAAVGLGPGLGRKVPNK